MNVVCIATTTIHLLTSMRGIGLPRITEPEAHVEVFFSVLSFGQRNINKF